MPGHTATFANYTSYDKGINGLMIDVRNLWGTPTGDDFLFRVGNDSKPYGSDRVTLIWDDGAIRNCLLQVTVLASDATGLVEQDVFYVGNAVGESGNSTGDAIVNATDEIGARNHPRGPFNPAAKDDPYDYNRDKLVNATDQIIARQEAGSGLFCTFAPWR